MSWLKEQIGEQWYTFLEPIIKAGNFQREWIKIAKDYREETCYPVKDNIFRAFKEVKLDKLRVILIGQDPYIDGVATGLSFDTNGKKTTPSLRKIYEGYTKEYPHNFYTDLMDGKLHRWTEHGILMLNTALTVQKGKSGSHSHHWKFFTTELFKKFNQIDRPMLYIAWGKHAQEVVKDIDNPLHSIITASHPASAIYSGKEWDSNGTFKGIEQFLNNNYDKSFKWER